MLLKRNRKFQILFLVIFFVLFSVLQNLGHVNINNYIDNQEGLTGWETKVSLMLSIILYLTHVNKYICRRNSNLRIKVFSYYILTFCYILLYLLVSRQLTSLPNCTPRAIEQFPKGLFNQEQRIHGAIIIHILVAVYMFGGFALICDDYFVPSLEILCDVFHIQSDVAGATFMAAGSSAPELATAIIAVFIAKDDIGLGAVVGSAVYNVMFVISVCALGAGMISLHVHILLGLLSTFVDGSQVVYLHWWPLFRDCAFYLLSIAGLAIVIADEKVYWYEAFVLVLLYVAYIILMYFNSRLESWIVPKFQCCRISRVHHKPAEKQVLYEKLREPGTSNGAMAMVESKDLKDIDEWDSLPMSSPDSDYDSAENSDETSQQNQMASSEEPESVFAIPDSCWKKLLWFISLPLKIILYISVPDCRQKKWKKYFIVTFTMCLVWLTVFSYLMVWMITIIGYTFNVPDTIMALTFVAFGVSLPDVISSLIVVREGYGDMAISNAVGSNVFDILICLGVPWLLQTVRSKGKPIQVYSEGLLYSTLTLILTVVFLLSATHINGWKLTKTYGVILMLIYFLFTILSSLYELNVFGFVHPNECVSHY